MPDASFGAGFLTDALERAAQPIREFMATLDGPDPLEPGPTYAPAPTDALQNMPPIVLGAPDALQSSTPIILNQPDPLQLLRPFLTPAVDALGSAPDLFSQTVASMTPKGPSPLEALIEQRRKQQQEQQGQQAQPGQQGQKPTQPGVVPEAPQAQAQAQQPEMPTDPIGRAIAEIRARTAPAPAAAPGTVTNPADTSGSIIQPPTSPGAQAGDVMALRQTHAAPYMAAVNKVAKEMGVPAQYLAALIDTENSGPDSVSPANARGLMQVVPGQGFDLPGEDWRDPETSIRQGARALKEKYRITGDWNRAFGAYFGYGTDAGGMTTGRYQSLVEQNLANYGTAQPQPPTQRVQPDQTAPTDVLTIQDESGGTQQIPRWYWEHQPEAQRKPWTVVNAESGAGKTWTNPDGTPFTPDQFGWEVPGVNAPAESQAMSATTNAVPALPAGAKPLQGRAVYQYGNEFVSQGIAPYICGPIAVQAFVQSEGRNPTVMETLDMARGAGLIDPVRGMHGIESTLDLIRRMGGDGAIGRADEQRMAGEVAKGNGVIVNTPGHYFFAEGYDPATHRFDFGNSARTLIASGGRTWFTLDELASLGMGAPAGAIYAGY